MQSNYSVFNSKQEGQLAIMAKLECIDTFSISLDAYLSEDNKSWNLYAFTNWSNDNTDFKNYINPYSIRVEDDGANAEGTKVRDIELYYPYRNGKIDDKESYSLVEHPDAMTVYPENESEFDRTSQYFIEPKKQEDPNSIKIYKAEEYMGMPPRENNGLDEDFPVKIGSYDKSKGFVTFNFYPCMPYGCLNWLKQTITLDFSKLGSGEMSFGNFRYNVSPTSITMLYSLNAYAERGKKVNSVSMDAYKLTESLYDSIVKYNIQNHYTRGNKVYECSSTGETFDGTLETAVETSLSPLSLQSELPLHIEFPKRTSYIGSFQQIINRSQFGDTEHTYVYLLQFNVDYNGEIIHFYRLLFNCDIYNDYYYDSSCPDFKAIKLQDALDNVSEDEKAKFSFEITSSQYTKDNKTEDFTVDAYKVAENGSKPADVESNYTETYSLDCNYKIDDISHKKDVDPDEDPIRFSLTDTGQMDINLKSSYTGNHIRTSSDGTVQTSPSEETYSIEKTNQVISAKSFLLDTVLTIPFIAVYNDTTSPVNFAYQA